MIGEWSDDVGVISIDDPALDHERAEIRYVYPHARSLVCLIGEENKAAMQSAAPRPWCSMAGQSTSPAT